MVFSTQSKSMSTRRKFECIKDLVCKLAMLDLPEEVQALRKKVETEFADYINGDTISLPWNIEDVHETAKEMATGLVEDPDESPLTDEQAREVLATTERRYDASIGVNWEVLGTHIRAARFKQADTYLSELSKQLAERYPHLSISYGYIGNCSVNGLEDDRSWRFFYVPEAGSPSKSFGGYSTASLSLFADYMRKNGIDEFERILQGHVNAAETGWMCKGSMKLGTGCGKCSRCINELTNINGKETL